MSQEAVANAFHERLRDEHPDVPLNVMGGPDPFNPPSSGVWFKAIDLPGEPGWEPWDDGKRHNRGRFRVLVYAKVSAGYFEQLRVAEQVVATFAKGTRLGPVGVSRRPWVDGPVSEGDRVFVPVTIPYAGVY